MAISADVDIIATALWPQGDARDPLGVWAGRHLITGDATGGTLKVAFQPGAERAGAHIYTCYTAIIAQLTISESGTAKARLLTNWPDADDDAGVQGYGALKIAAMLGSSSLTAPFSAPAEPLVQPSDRYILLFDPRPVAGAFTIVELEHQPNTDTRVYAFEAWGYYWDRGVLNAPGGLRHPGSG